MKNTNSAALGLIAAAALILSVWVSPARADFEAGWQAYQRGDFAAALKEWRPLAQSNDARAQYNLGILYDQGKGVALPVGEQVSLNDEDDI